MSGGTLTARNDTLYAGLAILGLFVLMALFAPLVAPYDPIFQDAGARLMAPGLAHPLRH